MNGIAGNISDYGQHTTRNILRSGRNIGRSERLRLELAKLLEPTSKKSSEEMKASAYIVGPKYALTVLQVEYVVSTILFICLATRVSMLLGTLPSAVWTVTLTRLQLISETMLSRKVIGTLDIFA